MSRKSSVKISQTGKVLVLGHDTRSFLAVVRSLGRKGLIVHVGLSSGEALALSSKYISKIHLLPPLSQSQKWKAEVQKIMQHEQFDIVIPTNDVSNLLFQRFREEFEPYGRIYLLTEEAFKITYNKMETYALCERCGVNFPKSELIRNNYDISTISENYKFPLILKPKSSVDLDNLNNRNYVKKIYHTSQLKSCLSEMLQKEDLIIQEYFEGIGVGVEILATDGKILVAFQHIRVHEPLKGGGSSYRKSMPVDKDLLYASEKLIKALNYTGVAMIEFRVDPKRGNWTLIEINGRFWGSLPLAIAAGIDFPYYLYQMLINGKQDFPTKYRHNIFCRNTTSDLSWLIERLKCETSLFKGLVSISRYLISGIAHTLCLRERNDTFVLDDPLPGIRELHNVTSAAYRAGARKTILHIRSTYPMRIYHAKKILNQLRATQSILFICKGNICRSPFAERYLQKISSHPIHVKSCGYYPQPGRLCPIDAILAGRNYGIDLEDHRSSVINDADLNNADIIFVFDWEDMSKVVSRFPMHRAKVWYLAEVTPRGTLEIPDPYGSDVSNFDKTYSQIRYHLDNIAEILANC